MMMSDHRRRQIVAAVPLAGVRGASRLHLDAELWSVDNGLLTPTFKLKRHLIKEKYRAEIDAMYAGL